MHDVVIVGDIHLADRAPSSRRDSYADEILAKLKWCVEFANEQRLPLVFAGDVMHIKTPWRTSYGLVQRLHDILRTAEAGVWIVPGNHDLSHDRIESIDSQPLGALSRMGNVRLLMGEDPSMPGIWGIPWLRDFDGGDWVSALGEDWQINDGEAELLVVHAPIFPPGKAPGVYASIDPEEWAIYWGDDVRATYYGHIHDIHGTYAVSGHTFCNNGAISRGSLHEETINRWPTITLWTGKDRTFQAVPLPESVVKPPADVFLFAEAEQKKQTASMTQAFETALGEVTLANLTTEEVLAYIRTENPSDVVLRVVEEVMEQASA